MSNPSPDFEIVEINAKEDTVLNQLGRKSSHTTRPYMTRYEYAKLVGCRALLIKEGDPPKVECEGVFDPLEIAKKEIHERVIPLAIKRRLPNGREEILYISDMNIRDY